MHVVFKEKKKIYRRTHADRTQHVNSASFRAVLSPPPWFNCTLVLIPHIAEP